MAQAVKGALPPVCVMTGAPAAGYLPLTARHNPGAAALRFALSRTRARYVVRLPMSATAFDRWHSLRARRIWLSSLGLLGIVAAIALRWVGPLAAVILIASVVSLAVALAAHIRAPWTQPSLTVDARGQWLTLAGVHEAFAVSLRR